MKLVEIRGELYEEVECCSVTGFSCSMCAFDFDCSDITCHSEKDVFYRKPIEDNNKMETKNMKTEKRILELNEPKIIGSKIKVTIKRQSHFCEKFGNEEVDDRASSFIASNGFKLRSFCGVMHTCRNSVYVRGSHTDRHDMPISFDSLEEYSRFVDAVKEYNEFEFVIKEPMPELKNKQYIKLSNGGFGFIVDNIVVYTTGDGYDYISDIEDKIVGIYEVYGTHGTVCTFIWKNKNNMKTIWEK